MRNIIALYTFAFLCTPLIACGSGEKKIDAQRYCEQENKSYYSQGQIVSADYTLDLELSENSVDGHVSSQQIQIQTGTLSHAQLDNSHPLILRFFDAQPSDNLMDQFASLVKDGPVTLEIFDATEIGAGSQNRTDLSSFPCTISEGTICMQLGLDLTTDQLLLSDDEYVYNAASGTLTIHQVDNRARKFSFSWSVNLGANILQFNDESRGNIEGCSYVSYDNGNASEWILR